VDEDDLQVFQVAKVGEGFDVVLGEIEFDEVEALGERGDFDVEGSVKDE
jgi:hypothetical protein